MSKHKISQIWYCYTCDKPSIVCDLCGNPFCKNEEGCNTNAENGYFRFCPTCAASGELPIRYNKDFDVLNKIVERFWPNDKYEIVTKDVCMECGQRIDSQYYLKIYNSTLSAVEHNEIKREAYKTLKNISKDVYLRTGIIRRRKIIDD